MKSYFVLDNNSKKSCRIVLALLSTLFVLLAVWILIDCFTLKRVATVNTITYKESKDVDYKVDLKDNAFFDSTSKTGKKYVANLIDRIYIDYDYDLVATDFFKSKTTYTTVATIKATYNDSKDDTSEVIWSKDYVLKPEKVIEIEDGTDINIKDKVTIDYETYNDLAKNFLNTIEDEADIVLDVKMYINTDGEALIGEKDFKESEVLNLSIPLAKDVISIKKEVSDDDNKRIVTHTETDENFNVVLFGIAIFIIVTVTPLMITSYQALYSLSAQDEYNHKLRRIKREIDDVMVKVDTKINLNKEEVVDVKDIDDLLNVHDELKLPINYLEVKKDKESWFIIITDEVVYRYILKAVVKNKRKKKSKNKQ